MRDKTPKICGSLPPTGGRGSRKMNGLSLLYAGVASAVVSAPKEKRRETPRELENISGGKNNVLLQNVKESNSRRVSLISTTPTLSWGYSLDSDMPACSDPRLEEEPPTCTTEPLKDLVEGKNNGEKHPPWESSGWYGTCKVYVQQCDDSHTRGSLNLVHSR